MTLLKHWLKNMWVTIADTEYNLKVLDEKIEALLAIEKKIEFYKEECDKLDKLKAEIKCIHVAP